jgi:hypothetical protein
MPIKSIARLIQTMLYARRMFPYYVYNVLSGIEEDGTGAVYSFDPVGSYERETCRAAGAAQSLLQPFLDNQVGGLIPELFGCLLPHHIADSNSISTARSHLDLLPKPYPSSRSTRLRPLHSSACHRALHPRRFILQRDRTTHRSR